MPESNTEHIDPDIFSQLHEARESFAYPFSPREVGYVTSVSAGIVKVSGLPGVGFEELLQFSESLSGIAYNIEEHEIGVILLGDDVLLNVGDEVKRTHRVVDIPVGDALIGRIINPLGLEVDGEGPIITEERLPIERTATAIMDRAAVSVPLQTGLKVIDALIPIGRGQRELILGDRQTGKTAIAIDAIINQADKNVICVYCAIGQRASTVAKLIANLKEKGAMEYTVVVVTEGNDPPGLKYIAPYAATSIAEYFMEKGRDVLIVYDDLTHHARAYRELSLLLRRPPGREAFPGDIFYIHSRLLERSTHLSEKLGGGSLTALPIIETEAQNISAYIPTNLISITDGQIYLSPKLFELGILPAVDVGKSVSRVGGKAQLPGYRSVTGNLKLAYAQFEELENYARFGTRLDEDTQKTIEHGKRIRSWLIQQELQPLSVAEQIVVLLALTSGYFDAIPLEKAREAEAELQKACQEFDAEIMKRLSSNDKLSDEDHDAILKMAKDILSPFEPKKDEKEEDQPEEKEEPEEKEGDKPEEKMEDNPEEKKAPESVKGEVSDKPKASSPVS
jgi:F-type H+-transporting ATPase subunit alpha